METSEEGLLRKIRALLALSRDKSNEHQAAAAAEKVSELLAKYNLSLADVEVPAPTEFLIVPTIRVDVPWQGPLARSVALLYACEHGLSEFDVGSVIHLFIGTKANTTVALLMFDYLVGAVEGRVQQELQRRANPPDDFALSFAWGATLTVCDRIRARIAELKRGKAEPGGSTTLPALAGWFAQNQAALAQWVDNKLGKPKEEEMPVSVPNEWAMLLGAIAGTSIGLDQQIATPGGLAGIVDLNPKA